MGGIVIINLGPHPIRIRNLHPSSPPPFFYMRLADASIGHATWPERKMALWERIYCWVLIVLGIAGGVLATYMALNNIFNASMVSPCYLMEAGANITISSSH